ncbi:MAG: ribosomal-protein-alanine acetyltransferase [Pseudomonadota bacterium]
MSVRRAVPGDGAALAALHATVFPSGPWDEAFWETAIGAPFDRVLVLGDPPRGFALFRIVGADADLLTIGTRTPGEGDGKSLLETIVIDAAAEGVESLFLDVSVANKAASTLYRSAGFAKVATRDRYYADGSDALVMRLDLTT